MAVGATSGGRSLDKVELARIVAIGGALGATALYLLIGLGVLAIGKAANGGTSDLFSFGAMMAVVFGVTALLLARFRSRAVLVTVAVLQVIVLVGYVAFAGVRDPAFELWGVSVKACQAIVLAAVVYLLTHREAATPRGAR
jgi:hypothetical protein